MSYLEQTKINYLDLDLKVYGYPDDNDSWKVESVYLDGWDVMPLLNDDQIWEISRLALEALL